MSANSWRLAACGAILVAVGAACSVTTTIPSFDLDGGGGGGGSDSGRRDATSGGGIYGDSGGGANGEAGGDAGSNPETGGGQCKLSNVIQFTKPACTTCAGAKCCDLINTCVDDKGDCVALFGCVVDCNNGVDGGPPAADGGGNPPAAARAT